MLDVALLPWHLAETEWLLCKIEVPETIKKGKITNEIPDYFSLTAMALQSMLNDIRNALYLI